MVTRNRTCHECCHQAIVQIGKLCTAIAQFHLSHGEGIDFEGIAPILLYGYDKLYYRKHVLSVACRFREISLVTNIHPQ